MSFPSSIDSFTGFTSGETLQAASHAAQSNQEQTAIVAVETKVGTGASTPTANNVLVGNGVGTSTWGQVGLSTGVSGILPVTSGGTGTGTSTGTGSVVLNSTPTTNNETATNLTSTKLNNSSGLTNTGGATTDTQTITGNATVGGTLGVAGVSTFTAVPVLPAGTITLASVSSSTSQSGLGSVVILTGLTSTVTIPAGGRTVRIELFVPSITNTANGYVQLSLYNSATVTGSAVQTATMPVGGIGAAFYMFYEYTPSPGSTSWCAAIQFSAGGTSGATALSSTSLAFLTIKAV